ncbi:hypothetical protein OK006_0860 [Actinobacteria bacterium OK006]|nr:hypothetical protein OK006_0860 [Actinobacteria bacterium OK006]
MRGVRCRWPPSRSPRRPTAVQREGGALEGVGEDRQRLRGLGGFQYSGTPDGEVGRLAGPVTRLVEAPLRGRGTAETDEAAHRLPHAEPVGGAGLQGAFVAHARVAGVSGEPSGVAQAPRGTRHLVGEAHGAGRRQGLAEMLPRLDRLPLVQQHGRTGAQEDRGLLGSGQLPDVREPFVEQFESVPVVPTPVGEHAQRVEAVRRVPAVPGRAQTRQRPCERLLGRRRTPGELLLEAEADIKRSPPPRVAPDLHAHPVVRGGPRSTHHRPQHHGEGQPQGSAQIGQYVLDTGQASLVGRIAALTRERVDHAQDVLLRETRGRLGAHGREQLPGRGRPLSVETEQPPEPGELGGYARVGHPMPDTAQRMEARRQQKTGPP